MFIKQKQEKEGIKDDLIMFISRNILRNLSRSPEFCIIRSRLLACWVHSTITDVIAHSVDAAVPPHHTSECSRSWNAAGRGSISEHLRAALENSTAEAFPPSSALDLPPELGLRHLYVLVSESVDHKTQQKDSMTKWKTKETTKKMTKKGTTQRT